MFFMPGCVVGVAFLLVTFLWPNKEKTLASKGEKQVMVYHSLQFSKHTKPHRTWWAMSTLRYPITNQY